MTNAPDRSLSRQPHILSSVLRLFSTQKRTLVGMSTGQTPTPSGPTILKPPPTKANKPQKPKDEKPQKAKDDVTAPGTETKLTPKQLKEQKKAEKQARRAADKANIVSVPGGKPDAGAAGEKKTKPQHSGKSTKDPRKGEKVEKGAVTTIGVSSGQSAVPASTKEIALFRHLESPERKVNVGSSHKDVHPAILALALQMASFEICGSNARCVATLLAFKRVTCF